RGSRPLKRDPPSRAQVEKDPAPVAYVPRKSPVKVETAREAVRDAAHPPRPFGVHRRQLRAAASGAAAPPLLTSLFEQRPASGNVALLLRSGPLLHRGRTTITTRHASPIIGRGFR